MLDTALEAKVLANKDESKCFKPLIAVIRPVRDRYFYFPNGRLYEGAQNSSYHNFQCTHGVVFAVYNQLPHCCCIDTVIVNEMQHVLMIVIMFLTNLSLLAQFCENLTRLHRVPPLIVTTRIVPGWQQHIVEKY